MPAEFELAALELAEKRGQEVVGKEGDVVPECDPSPSNADIVSGVPL